MSEGLNRSAVKESQQCFQSLGDDKKKSTRAHKFFKTLVALHLWDSHSVSRPFDLFLQPGQAPATHYFKALR